MTKPLLPSSFRHAGIAGRTLAVTAVSCALAAAVLTLATADGPDSRAPSSTAPGPQPAVDQDAPETFHYAVVPGLWTLPVAQRATTSVAPVQDPSLQRQFERHALNALLVPLLDDESDTQSWADPSLSMPCGPATTIKVDGRALEPGTPQPRRAFVLTWTLDRCEPFGIEGPVMSGHAELDVFRDDEGLSAIVRLQDLLLERQGRLARMTKTFTARTP